MFAKAGIDAVNDLKSFEDLYDVCRKLVDGGYTTYGIGFHPNGVYINTALGREGIMYYDHDNGYSGTIEKCLYTSDSTVNHALKTMLGVYQKLQSENLSIPYGTNYQKEIIPQLADGSCAMLMGVVSMTGKVLTAVGDNFEVGIIPMLSATDAGKRRHRRLHLQQRQQVGPEGRVRVHQVRELRGRGGLFRERDGLSCHQHRRL